MAVAASGKHFKVVKNEENKIHPLKSPRKSRLKPPFESTLKPFKPPFKPPLSPPLSGAHHQEGESHTKTL